MLTRSVSFLQQVVSGVKLFLILFLRIFDSVAGGICSSAIAFLSLWGLASTSSISLIFLLSEIDSLGFESAILTGVWQRSEAGFPFPIPAIKKGKKGPTSTCPSCCEKYTLCVRVHIMRMNEKETQCYWRNFAFMCLSFKTSQPHLVWRQNFLKGSSWVFRGNTFD